MCDRYREISGVNFSSLENSVGIVIFFLSAGRPAVGLVFIPRLARREGLMYIFRENNERKCDLQFAPALGQLIRVSQHPRG